MESLTIKVDELENELAKLSRSREEAQQTAEFQVRENRRLNGCCADLSRQVFVILNLKIKLMLLISCQLSII